MVKEVKIMPFNGITENAGKKGMRHLSKQLLDLEMLSTFSQPSSHFLLSGTSYH